MKKMLIVQNVRMTSQKPNKKSVKRRKKLRKKIFKILFRGIETLWMLMQIIQYVCQIFK